MTKVRSDGRKRRVRCTCRTTFGCVVNALPAEDPDGQIRHTMHTKATPDLMKSWNSWHVHENVMPDGRTKGRNEVESPNSIHGQDCRSKIQLSQRLVACASFRGRGHFGSSHFLSRPPFLPRGGSSTVTVLSLCTHLRCYAAQGAPFRCRKVGDNSPADHVHDRTVATEGTESEAERSGSAPVKSRKTSQVAPPAAGQRSHARGSDLQRPCPSDQVGGCEQPWRSPTRR